MKAEEFLSDLEARPTTLRALASTLADMSWPITAADRVLLVGMGSSWFAAETIARRLRRAGVLAVAEMAAVDASLPPDPSLTVIGVTASGTSHETVSLMARHQGLSRVVAVTNSSTAQLPADHTMLMQAGEERGGVACRTFSHTLALLLGLEHQLAGTLPNLADQVRRAADAIDWLLLERTTWLHAVRETLLGPSGCWLLAPAERFANALQGALMLREGPRLVADGCETGDWNHVDVYLTKSVDYRALLFTGSRFDGDAVRWMRERQSRLVAVGSHIPDAEREVRYPGDDDPIVALLTEVIVAEMVAADCWLHRDPPRLTG